MLVNICMKFHKDTFNGFKVTEQTYNSKSIHTRVMVFAFCMSSNVGLYEVS